MMRVLAVLFLAACASVQAKVRTHGECLTEQFSAASVPIFKQFIIESENTQDGPVQATIAEDFEVMYYDHFKVVKNLRAGESYVLYHCGLAPPAKEDLPAELQQLEGGFTNFFAVPLNRVSVPDTTAFGFLKELGLEDRISYVTAYTVDSCAAKLYESGDNACNKEAVAPWAFGPEFGNQVEMTDAVFSYGKDANSKVIAFTATSDPGSLQRAEWLKFMATFFNAEEQANALYNKIVQDYTTTREAAEAYVSQDGNTRPLVAWLYWQPAGGGESWSTLPAYENAVELKFSKYHVDYMKDAGGRVLDFEALKTQYVDGKNVRAKASGEDVLVFLNLTTVGDTLSDILKDVDMIVDETGHSYIPSTPNDEDLTVDEVLSIYQFKTGADAPKFAKNKKVIRVDGSYNGNPVKKGTTWFQEAVARPDVILKELSSILLPGLEANAVSSLKHLRLLGTHTPNLLTADKCEEEDYQDCMLQSSLICPLLYMDCDGSIKVATSEQRCAPTREECEAKSGIDVAGLDLTFLMDAARAASLAENGNDTAAFNSQTVKVIDAKLAASRSNADGKAYAKMIGATVTSSRRSLKETASVKVSYEVTVSGGDSAASDVDALLPQLSTGDEAAARKLWGDKLVDDNSITGSAASSPDPEPASPDGTTPNDGAAASHLVGLALCLGLLGAFLV